MSDSDIPVPDLDGDPGPHGGGHDGGGARMVWPASALDCAERAFQALVDRRPHPVAFDARDLGHGWPARFIPLDELRDLLVRDPRVSREAKDAAWHQIVDHARTWRQPWVAAATGLALPALVAMAGRLRPRREKLMTDVESELVAGFIHALVHQDLSGPAPQLRMCWAGWRAALLVQDPDTWEEIPELFDPSSRSPTRPYGHPDLLLGRAAQLGIITDSDAELISRTRLGRELLEQVAAERDEDPATLRFDRRRAEMKVVGAIAANVLSGLEPRAGTGIARRPRRARGMKRHPARSTNAATPD
jgi:hypothetical protein